MTAFGPQLIGETEKTLNALLRQALDGTGLSEPHWVTLQLANAGASTDDQLTTRVRDRAHFEDAATLVDDLTTYGLLSGGQLTKKGQSLIEEVRGRIRDVVGGLFDAFPEDDIAAATRVLNTLLDRARVVLAAR